MEDSFRITKPWGSEDFKPEEMRYEPAPLRPPGTELCGELVNGNLDLPCQRKKGHDNPGIHVGPWRQGPEGFTADTSDLVLPGEAKPAPASPLDGDTQKLVDELREYAQETRDTCLEPDPETCGDAATFDRAADTIERLEAGVKEHRHNAQLLWKRAEKAEAMLAEMQIRASALATASPDATNTMKVMAEEGVRVWQQRAEKAEAQALKNEAWIEAGWQRIAELEAERDRLREALEEILAYRPFKPTLDVLLEIRGIAEQALTEQEVK